MSHHQQAFGFITRQKGTVFVDDDLQYPFSRVSQYRPDYNNVFYSWIFHPFELEATKIANHKLCACKNAKIALAFLDGNLFSPNSPCFLFDFNFSKAFQECLEICWRIFYAKIIALDTDNMLKFGALTTIQSESVYTSNIEKYTKILVLYLETLFFCQNVA